MLHLRERERERERQRERERERARERERERERGGERDITRRSYVQYIFLRALVELRSVFHATTTPHNTLGGPMRPRGLNSPTCPDEKEEERGRGEREREGARSIFSEATPVDIGLLQKEQDQPDPYEPLDLKGDMIRVCRHSPRTTGSNAH